MQQGLSMSETRTRRAPMGAIPGRQRRRRLPLFVQLALITLLVGAALSGTVSSGVTYTAAITVIITAVALLMLPLAWLRGEPSVRRALVPLFLFLGWALLVTAYKHHFDKQGAQNLCVYMLFAATIAIVAATARRDTIQRFASAVVMVGWVQVIAYGGVLLLKGFDSSGIDARRAFGIEGALIMTVLLSIRDRRVRGRILPYLLTLEVGLSGSRTATIVAVAILILFALREGGGVRKAIKLVTRLAVAVATIVVIVNAVPSVHSRVFGGDRASLFGIELNTEGRAALWSVVIADTRQHNMWIGSGAGSAADVVSAEFGAGQEPHNDYLRLWHDFGYIGAGLWIIAILNILLALTWCWWRTRERFCCSAIAGVLALCVIMLTDNVIIYYFAILPLGVMIGLALASLRAQPPEPILL